MSLVIADGGTQYLVRTTGLIPGNSDYSCSFWFRRTNNETVDYRTIFAFTGTLAQYVGIFTNGGGDELTYLSADNGSGASSTTGFLPVVNQWYPIGYSREGAVHSYYINYQLIGTFTEDMSSVTINGEYLGNDSASGGASNFKEFREWNKAKTYLELNQEWQSSTVVDADSLWADYPLTTDANDISGNARDWTPIASPTYNSSNPHTDYNVFYFCNIDPPIDPTNKGSWNQQASNRFYLHPVPQGADIASRTASESSSTNPFALQICKIVSPPLATQTISGNFDFILGALESNADMNAFTKIYIYVTEGDSTTLVRGVLLDYTESSGAGSTEWPTTAAGIALQSTQALSSVAITDGDYLVIEFGVSAENATTSTRTATTYRGSLQDNYRQYPVDLSLGSTAVTTRPGYFWFENSIQLQSTEVLNNNADRAITVSGIPYTATPSALSNYATDLFYVYSSTVEGYKSAFAGTSASGGNEEPQMFIYQYIADVVTDIGNSGTAQLRAWQFPNHAGIDYYFRISESAFINPPGITVTFNVVEGPSSLPDNKEGIIFIPDDVVAVNYEPLAAYVDPVTGEILQIQTGFPVTENGISSRIDGNIIITGGKSPYLGNVYFYDKNTVLLDTDTTTLSASGQTNPPVAASANFFYAAQYVSGDGTIRIRRWTFAGVLDATTWDIPLPASWTKVSAITVDSDDTTLYYSFFSISGSSVTNDVHRWDLVNDIALTDFYALPGVEQPQDILYSTDNFIYLGITDASVTPSICKILKFNTSGTLILTITLDVANFGTLDHFTLGVDDTLTLTVWQQKQIGVSAYVAHTFTEFNVNNGTQISQLTNVLDFHRGIGTSVVKGALPDQYFGINNSCPLIILLSPGEPPPPVNNPLSGIYKIVPNSFKTTDTLWIALDPETTQEVEIPNPFIITGGIGN